MKAVINTTFYGFCLSKQAEEELEKQGFPSTFWSLDKSSSEPALIKLVEDWGERSFGKCSVLKVVEFPDDVEWYIEEHDGCEWVAERHRTWE